jgi:transposase
VLVLTGHELMEVFMARPYSADLRERVLRVCERREISRAEIAERYGVCEATVYNWLQQAREENRRAAKPHAGGPPPRLDAAMLVILGELVAEQRDATLAEYADRLAARTGVRVSLPVLCVQLRRLGLRRKKRRSGRASRIAPTSPRRAPRSARSSRRSTPSAWSSSTRAASRPR